MSVKLVTVFLKWLLEMRAVGMMDFSFFLTFPLLPPPFIIFYVQTENYTIGSFGSQVFRLELIVLTKYMTETTWERKGLFGSRFHMVYSIMVGTRVGWSSSHHGGPVRKGCILNSSGFLLFIKSLCLSHRMASFHIQGNSSSQQTISVYTLYTYPIGWLHPTSGQFLFSANPLWLYPRRYNHSIS